MKRLWHILGLGLLLAVMVRCGNSPDSAALTGTPSQSGITALDALEEIDSLMWKQPDSALTVMLEFAGSPEADSLDEFEGHYCQMLIAELLYKNDYEQLNREELLKAVDYFDSIVAADGYKTDIRRDAPRASAKNVQNIAFLDARAHYINGVGFYEKDDMVNACTEYLRTLKIMEAHFEETELVEKKAIFMTYNSYNRLMDHFSTMFMMDTAIECWENVLMFCDTVSSKALSDYKSGVPTESSLDELFSVLKCSETKKERLNRYLTIGDNFFHEGNYDSALFYLEPVFEDFEAGLQAQAEGYLRIIYDSIGKEQFYEYMRFSTNHKKPEGENNALFSKFEDTYKNYSNQKLDKEAEETQEMSIRKSIAIIVPIAIVFALSIIVLAKLRSKKLLKEQQEEADRALGEAEEKHEKELMLWQAEADRTLEETEKKYEEELEQLKVETKQRLNEAKLRHIAFLKEPICQSILNKLSGKNITTRNKAYELGIALKDEDFEQLRTAVEKHYEGFDNMLLSQCPSLKHGYLALCHLHLLGLSESEIAALKNVSYSAIRKQNEILQEKLGVNENISAYVLKMAEGLCGAPNVEREKQMDMNLQRTKKENSCQPVETNQESSLKSSQKILELISTSPSITISEIADHLGITKRGVDKNIKKLKEKGIIRRVGPDKGGYWEVM